jgi:hypothetical protein
MKGQEKKWTSESKRYNINTYSGELNEISRLASFRWSGAAAGISSFRSKPQSHAENNEFRKLKFTSQGHESFQEVQSQGRIQNKLKFKEPFNGN